jgi:hypothetical protein
MHRVGFGLAAMPYVNTKTAIVMGFIYKEQVLQGHIEVQNLLQRSWGEVFGQSLSVWGVLSGFYWQQRRWQQGRGRKG